MIPRAVRSAITAAFPVRPYTDILYVTEPTPISFARFAELVPSCSSSKVILRPFASIRALSDIIDWLEIGCIDMVSSI
ncbi:hypothetical protein LEP1GSC165_0013 [Leptospira santarosai str. CBC523]|nr:hypothetical protein LEP1GSC165_0013 [Leptospira santarosai str. CBC523]